MKFKFLVCMTSFKRPLECMYQIHKFMDMNYPDMLMSVIVRGVDSFTYENQIIPTVQKYIDQHKLVISKKENSTNLFKNITDCIDQCPEYKYDYFLKIDDDDWYSLDYLSVVYTHLNTYRNSSGTNVDQKYITITGKTKDGTIKTIQNFTSMCGGTIVCNKRLSEIYMEVSNDPSKVSYVIREKYKINMKLDRAYIDGQKEDKLLQRLVEFGKNEDEVYFPIEISNLYSIYRIYDGCMKRDIL